MYTIDSVDIIHNIFFINIMDINTYFDKIFIINLDKRTDRWNTIVENLKQNNIYNYERISAIQPHPTKFKNKPKIYENLSKH